MKFTWDENKNQINIQKRGIDFHDAHHIFDGPMIVDIDNRIHYGEDRLKGFGFLGDVVVIVIFVEKEMTIRIISIRKAKSHEKKYFEQELQNRYE